MTRLALIFVVVLLAVAAVYRHAPTQFLRAESGWYLAMSHADDVTQRSVVRNFFTTSYGGHYTPLAFLSEFATAKIAGALRMFWKYRQVLVLALAGTATFVALDAIAGLFVDRWRHSLVAGALTAVAIFQPAMVELVAWPFMVMQLLWWTISMVAVYAIARAAADVPASQEWVTVAVAAAYGSMHVSGLGLITVTAGFAALIALRASIRRKAIVVIGCLAAAHAAAMVLLLPHGSAAGGGVPVIGAVRLLLGFIARFAVAGAQSFTGIAPVEANPFAIGYTWPFGLAILLIAAVFLGRVRKTDAYPAAALWCGSLVAFVVMCLMIGVRLTGEKSLHAAATNLAYLTHAPRYIVPLHVLLLPAATVLLASVVQRWREYAATGCVLLILAAPVAQVQFCSTTYYSIEPLALVSHRKVWRLIRETAQQCRAAHLPLPNVPLKAVTQEFSDWDARMFEPLLRDDLHLAPGEPFPLVEWRDYLNGDRTRYVTAVPALQRLERRLGVSER
ncbi:MAG: hypothetical protein ACJ8KU_07015 [Chthoniobacterales bacterium]